MKTKVTYDGFRGSRLREKRHVRWLHYLQAHVTRYLDAASHMRGPEGQEWELLVLRELHDNFVLSGVISSDAERWHNGEEA